LSFLADISSRKKLAVASHSRFGLVAMIISIFVSASEILLNREEKFRSHTNIPFIGEIEPHKIWYTQS